MKGLSVQLTEGLDDKAEDVPSKKKECQIGEVREGAVLRPNVLDHTPEDDVPAGR